MFKSIRSRLALSFAGIALVAAVVLGIVLLFILQSYYSQTELDYMRGNAKAIGAMLSLEWNGHLNDQLQSQIANLAFLSQTRVRVLDLRGEILYDSGVPQPVNVGLGEAAQGSGPGETSGGGAGAATFRIISTGVELTKTLGVALPGSGTPPPKGTNQVIIYRTLSVSGSPFGFYLNADLAPGAARSSQTVMVPVADSAGQTRGTVELSDGPALGRDILTSVAWGWTLASAVAILLAAGAGWLVSGRISAPVLALTAVTTRMAQGDLSRRAPVTGDDEFGQLARSFDEMADQVEATVGALRHFVSDAAHELNTPLTALRTNLDLAQTSEDAEERAAFVARAQSSAAELENLNRDLIDLSRIEALPAAGEDRLDLAALLRDMEEGYASRAEQAGLSFETNLPPEPVWIHGAAQQVQRALGNLVENAVKFTPEGGAVRLEVRQVAGQVSLIVSDTGIGIPAEDLPQLFNRFHRGRNATAFPGNGLGLAIVKTIVERSGGRVAAKNADPGSRFTVTWPSGE